MSLRPETAQKAMPSRVQWRTWKPRRARVGQRFAAVGRGPLEDVDRMLLALIDERGNGAAGEVIESAAVQRKAERSEGVDLGREVQFAQKPRFDGVLIGGADVKQMRPHQSPARDWRRHPAPSSWWRRSCAAPG